MIGICDLTVFHFAVRIYQPEFSVKTYKCNITVIDAVYLAVIGVEEEQRRAMPYKSCCRKTLRMERDLKSVTYLGAFRSVRAVAVNLYIGNISGRNIDIARARQYISAVQFKPCHKNGWCKSLCLQNTKMICRAIVSSFLTPHNPQRRNRCRDCTACR